MVFQNNLIAGAAGATGTTPFDTTLIGNSVWFDSSDYLTQDTAEADSGRKEAIFSTWLQRSKLGAQAIILAVNGSDANDYLFLSFEDDDTMILYNLSTTVLATTQVFRDIGWYHILVTIDTSQNNNNSQKIFVNGTEITTFSTRNNFGSSADIAWGRNATHLVSSSPTSVGSNTMIGYMAQTALITDKSFQQGDYSITDFLDTFTLGTNGSQFVPKADSAIATIAGAGGNNSFSFNFSNSSDLGNDTSGNNNDFTATSMASANQSSNTPSNVYAVMDILKNNGADNSTITFAGGNLRVTGASGSDGGTFSTLPLPTSGTTEFQSTWNNGDGIVGICCYDNLQAVADSPSKNVCNGLALPYNASYGYMEDGRSIVVTSSGTTASTFGAAMTTNSVLTVRYNADDNEITFLKDDSAQGSAISTVAGLTYYAFASRSNNYDITMHFEEGKFPHTIGSGNKTLSSAKLTAPDYQGIDYFDATLYEGNGRNQRVGDFVPFTDTYAITNSAMWNNADIRRLSHTYSSESAATSDSTDQATISFWVKYIEHTNNQVFLSQSNSGQTERFLFLAEGSGSGNRIYITIDPSGSDNNRSFMFKKDLFSPQEWSHFLLHLDTNNATAADRMKVWINGNAVTNEETTASLGSSARPYTAMTQGQNLNLFRDMELQIGHLSPSDTYDASYNFNSYLAEIHIIDGSCQAVSNFGQVDTSTNRWIAKDYKTDVGTYGNRGFYLKFDGTPGASSGSNMGKDSSGNNIHLTEETHGSGASWAAGDKTVDTPSKNFTIFSSNYSGGGSNVWTEGNTKVKGTDGTNSDSSTTTFGMTGKVVFQFQMNTVGGGYPKCGFITSQAGLEDINATSGSIELGASSVAGSVSYDSGGNFSFASGPTATTFSSVSSLQALDADDVLRYEIDTDTGTIKVFFQNEGSGSFTEVTGARVTNFPFDSSFGVRPAVSNYNNSIVTLQTGGQTTLSSVTTDFKEINQDNLDDTASKLTAFAWIKNRDSTDNHMLFDRIRGINNDIHTNSTAIQVTNAYTVQRFLQRGVQIGSDAEVNTATESYVLWQWLVGDTASTGSTIAAGSVSTGVPSIASTAIAADAGHFSVVKYTGDETSAQTVGHGLGGIAEAIIVKNLEATSTNWPVLHKDLGSIAGGGGNYILLNGYALTYANANYWNDTSPTSTVFSIGSGATPDTNDTDKDFIAYCFRSIAGVCKVGVYAGNSNDNGPYISCGFKPRWILVKCATVSDASHDWLVLDTARYTYNGTTTAGGLNGGTLEVNDNTAEEAHNTNFTDNPAFDILADGFKLKSNSGVINAIDSTTPRKYIYIAMAEIGGGGTLPPIYGR